MLNQTDSGDTEYSLGWLMIYSAALNDEETKIEDAEKDVARVFAKGEGHGHNWQTE